MSIEVVKYSPEQWYSRAEDAHTLVFKKQRDPWMDRISYALLAVKNDEPIGYVTCRETDRDSVYWQFGGFLDEFKGLNAVKGTEKFLNICDEKYNQISDLDKNDNINCLHLLMKMGFRAIGIRVFENEIFLEIYRRNKGE